MKLSDRNNNQIPYRSKFQKEEEAEEEEEKKKKKEEEEQKEKLLVVANVDIYMGQWSYMFSPFKHGFKTVYRSILRHAHY